MKNKKHTPEKETENKDVLMPENVENAEQTENNKENITEETDKIAEEIAKLNQKCEELNDKNLRNLVFSSNFTNILITSSW